MNIKQDVAIIKENKDIVIDKEIIDDLIALIMGDLTVLPRLVKKIKEYPIAIADRLFLTKFEYFLRGIKEFDYDERMKFSERIVAHEGDEKYVYALVENIDKCDTYLKMEYITSANRALSMGQIDRECYFRIWHIILITSYEDLKYMKDNYYKKETFSYDYAVQGLFSAGLMYVSDIDGGGADGKGENLYSFTPLAKLVMEYALDFNTDHFGDRNKKSIENPKTDLGIEAISDEEIDEMWNEIFENNGDNVG